MKSLKKHWFSYLVLLLATFTALFPLFWTVSTSIKFKVETYVLPPKFIDFTPTAKNYQSLFAMESFTRIYTNTILITFFSTMICLIAGSFTAYAIARRAAFFGRRPLEATMIAIRALPGIVVVLPLFGLGSYLGIYDNIWAITLIYAGFTISFAVWLMTSFFEQIPIEIEEAARMDGAGTVVLFRKVLLPIAAPGIVATGIFVALLNWNEFLIPVILAGENSKTLPVLVASFISNRNLDWGPMAAAATVAIIPIAIFTVLIQKWLVSGLSGGAIKE